jgi:hypothetical protein
VKKRSGCIREHGERRVGPGARRQVSPAIGSSAKDRGRVWGRLAAPVILALALVALTVVSAMAAGPGSPEQVINDIRDWAMKILFGLTTLYLTIAGVRYVMAGHSPNAMEEAKHAVRNALLGYGLAALAPMLADIVKRITGG